MKKEHRHNCIRLMLAVHEWPWESELDMCEYYNHTEAKLGVYDCNTVACFLGHAPAAGIGDGQINAKYGFWSEYSVQMFGLSSMDDAWYFLFYDCWPNSKSQCVARMHLFLTKGVPQGWDYESSKYRLPTEPEIEVYKKEINDCTKAIH